MIRNVEVRHVARLLCAVTLLLTGFSLALPARASDPPIPAGTVRIHYYRPDNHFSRWTLWTWGASTENQTAWCSTELNSAGTDSYGAYWNVTVNPTRGSPAGDLGFIVHNCALNVKDPDPDMHLNVLQYNEAWVISGDDTVYTAEPTRQQLLNGVFHEGHDVSFVSQGVTLRGTVYIPKSPSFAAAVWVDGAGDRPRNSAVGQLLAQHGLAVLVYDKRGVGKSGGIYAGPEVRTNNVTRANLSLLADDAAAALRVLRGERALRGVPLGFIGASQAGWIIPPAALKNRDARFMVLWSGAVETTHEDVLFEHVAMPDKEFWDHHTHEEVQKMMAGVPDHFAWASFDPREALSKLKIPGLWIFGGRDRNMNADLSIIRLKELIAAGHPEYSYRVFPGYDHNLGGEQEDVLEPCLAWIREKVTKPLTR